MAQEMSRANIVLGSNRSNIGPWARWGLRQLLGVVKGQEVTDFLEEGWIAAFGALKRGDALVFWATIPEWLRKEIVKIALSKAPGVIDGKPA